VTVCPITLVTAFSSLSAKVRAVDGDGCMPRVFMHQKGRSAGPVRHAVIWWQGCYEDRDATAEPHMSCRPGHEPVPASVLPPDMHGPVRADRKRMHAREFNDQFASELEMQRDDLIPDVMLTHTPANMNKENNIQTKMGNPSRKRIKN
jgi:hypothetical protein